MPDNPLRLEYWPASQLAANPKNWRVHPAGQISALRGVMKKVGWADAVLWNETTGRLIDGHARLQISKPGDLIPVMIGNWSEEDEDFILTTFDPVGQLAMSDISNLSALLAGIETDDHGVKYLLQQIQVLTPGIAGSGAPRSGGGGDGSGDDDNNGPGAGLDDDLAGAKKHAVLQKKWRVKPGDVWSAGEHIVCCDDSRTHAYTEHCQLLLTSPPYAQQRSYKDADMDWNALVPPVILHGGRAMRVTGHILVNLGLVIRESRLIRYWDPLLDAMDEEWRLCGWYVWDKMLSLPGISNERLKLTHEWVFHWSRDGSRWPAKIMDTKHAGKDTSNTSSFGRSQDGMRKPPCRTAKPIGDKKVMDSVLRAGPANASQDYHDHPAPYSTGFCMPYIETFTEPGEYVLDPFAGAGTTGMAAHEVGRRAYLVEVAPEYVSIILQRFEDRGLKPVRRGAPADRMPDNSPPPQPDAGPPKRAPRKAAKAGASNR